jgi:hypothetical protein
VLGHAVEHRFPVGLLLLFYFFPPLNDLVRVTHLIVAEHMGVPQDDLVYDGPGHVIDGKGTLLPGYLRVQVNLEEDIAELFLYMACIAAIDGVKRFVCLLDKERLQGLMRLLPVPGTAVFSSQDGYDFLKQVEGALFFEFHMIQVLLLDGLDKRVKNALLHLSCQIFINIFKSLLSYTVKS